MHDTVLSAVLAVICLVSVANYYSLLRYDKCHFRSFEMTDMPFSTDPCSPSWRG